MNTEKGLRRADVDNYKKITEIFRVIKEKSNIIDFEKALKKSGYKDCDNCQIIFDAVETAQNNAQEEHRSETIEEVKEEIINLIENTTF